MTLKKCALTIAILTALVVSFMSACGNSDPKGFDPSVVDSDGGKRDGSGGQTICLLNNCATSDDCADCAQGRTQCLQGEHRCIACTPGSTGTCKQGQYCTKYGDCVPAGTQCAEDGQGNPQISCNADSDCAACNPKHRVCDTGQHKCVGCTPSNVTNCQSTDVCVNDACVAKCPSSCTTDADCGQCGAPGHEAHACNNHKCAACSPTVQCADGGLCDMKHGICEPPCGVGGHVQQCYSDANCAGCKGSATSCDLPINGGLGTCVKPATGCSDFGKGVAVLPPPFDKVTNACSKDFDCANVDVDVNAGKMLRDITGISGIGDASFSYPMHACASVRIINKASCGVCVPCRKDADCTDISFASLAGQAFGPLGSIAERLLVDKIFGPNSDSIHMYCEPIVDGYGACVPCADFLHACGDNSPQVDGAPCDHDICTQGGALGPKCSTCTADVCATDPYCCDPKSGEWDSACVTEVDIYCKTATCAPPDSCFGKATNTWYCSEDIVGGAFHCDDQAHVDKTNTCIPDGGAGQEYCHKQGTGHTPTPSDNAPKDPAVVDATGVPTCFGTP